MSFKKGTEIPTIDVVLVTITTHGDSPKEIALDTANKIGVNPVIETTDAVKLIVKGKLLSQKPQENTITGNTIVLTDNVFNPELAQILQGGTVEYDEESGEFVSYTPPTPSSNEKGEVFDLNAYSAIYSTAGLITGYEKVSYPNCQGTPFGVQSEDGVFAVSEYTINSAPEADQAPYNIEIVKTLPTVSTT